MAGKRQNEIDMLATKGDIIKDIVADTISQEIHRETGIACTKRENTEIRINIIKLEELVKQYDLNNAEKEVPLYEKKEKKTKIKNVEKLKTYAIVKADLDERRALKAAWRERGY